MKAPFLIGRKIYLRPLEPEDVPSLKTWVNDAEISRYLLLYRPMTNADEQAFLDRTRGSATEVVLGIALRATDRLIGTTGLHAIHPKDRHAIFGILIGDKRCWNRGYGSEATALMVRYAFETLNLHRVALQVLEHNLRGVRAYEKAGFQREGVSREDTFRDGRYWNTVHMGVLRDDWLKSRPPGEGKPTKRR
ncbi:MAG TPA: GNAT family protein [Candidatus Eisenbacteria bacterium]